MTPEQIKNRIANLRDGINTADSAHGVEQIGLVLIALDQLTDLVEFLLEKAVPAPVEPDRYEAARHEYQAERRIDEWAAYQREQDY